MIFPDFALRLNMIYRFTHCEHINQRVSRFEIRSHCYANVGSAEAMLELEQFRSILFNR